MIDDDDVIHIKRSPPRLWLLFFYDGEDPAWWQRWLKVGYRHVCAASFYSDIGMWVYYNPTRKGTVLEVWPEHDFGPRFAQLLKDSTSILRIRQQEVRDMTPLSWWCVGAMKALLGIRSGALSPFQLYRDLRAKGAEEVERELIQRTEDPAGGSTDESAARS